MFGLVVMEVMTLSGHLSNINEIEYSDYDLNVHKNAPSEVILTLGYY
jgi:hypothetical protein